MLLLILLIFDLLLSIQNYSPGLSNVWVKIIPDCSFIWAVPFHHCFLPLLFYQSLYHNSAPSTPTFLTPTFKRFRISERTFARVFEIMLQFEGNKNAKQMVLLICVCVTTQPETLTDLNAEQWHTYVITNFVDNFVSVAWAF